MSRAARNVATLRVRRHGMTLLEWQALARRVFERDHWRCCLVGCQRGLGPLQAHHVIARGAGGVDAMTNLVSLHPDCHEKVQREWRKWVPAFQAYLRGVANG